MTERIQEFLRNRRKEGHDVEPCLVVDLEVVRDNYQSFAKALPDSRVFYAVKANPAPEVLSLLATLGSCFDCASVAEIEMALAAGAPGLLGRTVEAVQALENGVLALPEGIVLRYAFLYGPGTWFVDGPGRTPAVHVDAAAQAALLALSKGKPGVYNVGEDDPGLSSEKAKRELGFDASFRLDPPP